MSEETAQTIRKFLKRGITELDAAALFWFARNQFFFQQRLQNRDDVMLCNYEHLVSEPNSVMQQIYNFVGLSYPGAKIVSDIHQGSMMRGAGIQLDDEIEAMCSDLNQRLIATAQESVDRWSLAD